jgi:hypothetical protein
MTLSVGFFGRFGSIVVLVTGSDGSGISSSSTGRGSSYDSDSGTITGIIGDTSGIIGFVSVRSGRAHHCIPTQNKQRIIMINATNFKSGFIEKRLFFTW